MILQIQEGFNCENELINEVRLDFKRYIFMKINLESWLIKMLATRGFASKILMLRKGKLSNTGQPTWLFRFHLMFSHPVPDPAEDTGKYIIKYLNRG